jgi:hypothetical protein
MTDKEAFKAWWYNEGSQAPYTHHDCEEHTMRMCEIAWANGAFKEREAFAKIQFESLLQAIRIEREACAKVCESLPMQQEIDVRDQCAAAIRARGQA